MRSMFRGRAGVPVAFVLGLVIATAGTAGAARLITGKQIKDGSISAKDLSKTLRIKIAKAGSSGTQGPQGPQGPQGVQGDKGPMGPGAVAVHRDLPAGSSTPAEVASAGALHVYAACFIDGSPGVTAQLNVGAGSPGRASWEYQRGTNTTGTGFVGGQAFTSAGQPSVQAVSVETGAGPARSDGQIILATDAQVMTFTFHLQGSFSDQRCELDGSIVTAPVT